jgi:hypothetical protein
MGRLCALDERSVSAEFAPAPVRVARVDSKRKVVSLAGRQAVCRSHCDHRSVVGAGDGRGNEKLDPNRVASFLGSGT